MAKEKIKYKINLLLDLDETTFIALSEEEFALHGASEEGIKRLKNIHSNQVLSKPEKNGGFYFFVLNPEKLKKMIEAIYAQGDEIIIFTAGLWLPAVLSIVARLCDLSNETTLLFQRSTFLNPQHDGEKLGFSTEAIRGLLKAYRLHGLFRSMPVLRNHHFVLLDNDTGHIDSCKNCAYLDGVTATTNTDDFSFYDSVVEQMQLARLQGATTSPGSIAYFFPEDVLKAFLGLEASDSTPGP